jgi:hypothetical protein
MTEMVTPGYGEFDKEDEYGNDKNNSWASILVSGQLSRVDRHAINRT